MIIMFNEYIHFLQTGTLCRGDSIASRDRAKSWTSNSRPGSHNAIRGQQYSNKSKRRKMRSDFILLSKQTHSEKNCNKKSIKGISE